MSVIKAVESILAHPSPGLVFPAHPRAKVGERAYRTPHVTGDPPSPAAAKELAKLAANPALADLVALYSRWNGLGLCVLWESELNQHFAAIRFAAVEEWDELTMEWAEGSAAYWREDCPMYDHGSWRVIADMAMAGVFVIFLDGEYEGKPLAGKMFCLANDPMLGYEDELAPSFAAFVEEVTANPFTLLSRLAFTWSVSDGKPTYGDPPSAYVPDIRDHPSLREWDAR